MADPQNPGAPPLDPSVNEQFNRMADRLRQAEATTDAAKRQAEAASRVTNELDKQFKTVEKGIDSYKELTKLMKRIAAEMKTQGRDAGKIREVLEEIVEKHEEALKNERAGSKEFKTMREHLHRVKKELDDLPRTGKVLETQFGRINDLVDDLATNVKSVAKAMAGLGRTAATFRGFAGIAEAMGMGRPATAIDKRLERIENVRQAVEDSRDLRKAATTKHMKDKRAKSIDQLAAAQKKGGGYVNPRTGEVEDFIDAKGNLTGGGRRVLADKMGFKKGTDKYEEFMKGESAIAKGGEAGEGYAAALASGTGGMESLSGVLESIEGELMEFAPEIMILIEAIQLLAELFGSYAKQNKEMEKSIGKGGLFTQPGVGAGSAFMNARNALLPGGGDMGTGGMFLGAGLGINWERNLAIAGQLANQGGMNIVPGMTTGGNAANLGPGAMGEFGRGGFGEIQRVVMGAGRVGGLTDQEGVEQVIKLLGEYRETIASSEDFMAQLNKDTAAAGISTTKYLKIIDDVSGAFDRMSKSLDQTVGIMRELSRYGAVSSESLKDMMEFLSKGQAKTDTGNMATAAFTQNIMPKDILEGVRAAQQSTLSNYVDEYNAEASKHGMGKLNVDDIQQKIKAGDFSGAQGLADSMMGQIDKVTDPTIKQPMLDALTKVQDQINRVSGVMSPDFLKRASAQGLYGMNEADKLGALLANIRGSTAFAGMSVTDLLSGKGSAEQQIMLQQLTQQLGITGSPAQINMALRRMGQNRVTGLSDQTINADERSKDAKAMMDTLYKGSKTKGGWRVFLEEKGGLAKKLAASANSMEDVVSEMMKTPEGIKELQGIFQKNLEPIAGSAETQDKLLKSTQEGHKQTAETIADQISQARGIAMRTQTVGELLSNTFKPLMIKLVYGIEKIATTVTSWFSKSNSGQKPPDVEDPATQMAKVSDAVKVLNTQLDTGNDELNKWNALHMKDGKFDTQESKKHAQELAMNQALGADTLTKMETAMQSGVVGSDVMDAVNKITQGQKNVTVGDAAKGVTINNFYSSTATMDVAQPAGPSTSTESKTSSPKTQPAAKGTQ